MDVQYRKIGIDDAEEFWNLMNALDEETNYMMYEPGEREKDLDEIHAVISQVEKGNDFLMLAIHDAALIGYVLAQRGRQRRIRHSAYVVTGIRCAYRKQGIGTRLFHLLDQWAKEHSITRLELTVVCENENALSLYKKFGYQIEGRKVNSLLLEKRYLDEFYMAKQIGSLK